MTDFYIIDMKSIDAELDAILQDRAHQMARLNANWPAHALKRKQLEIDRKATVAYAYWLEKQRAALTLVHLSEQPIQCKAESMTPNEFITADQMPRLKYQDQNRQEAKQ